MWRYATKFGENMRLSDKINLRYDAPIYRISFHASPARGTTSRGRRDWNEPECGIDGPSILSHLRNGESELKHSHTEQCLNKPDSSRAPKEHGMIQYFHDYSAVVASPAFISYSNLKVQSFRATPCQTIR